MVGRSQNSFGQLFSYDLREKDGWRKREDTSGRPHQIQNQKQQRATVDHNRNPEKNAEKKSPFRNG